MSEWKMVPVEPTPEMIEAICEAHAASVWPDDYGQDGRAIRRGHARTGYAAMLAAAPAAPPAEAREAQGADTSFDGGSNPPNRTLYLLTAKHGLNMVVGDDMRRLLEFGRSCWQAALAAPPVAQEADEQEAFDAWWRRPDRHIVINRTDAWCGWDARASLSAAPVASQVRAEAVAFSERNPPPHTRYLVFRGGSAFTATPCYGMHAPWWVCNTASGEVEPVDIEPTDRWISLDATPQSAPSDPAQVRAEALEQAARICESVNNSDSPMTAQDCADAIRALGDQP
ncbi:MAG: hypothetical protein KF822_09575 [Steroidobacteraceae bacterium]|nr:hypothetical protein [Steroidobacteraceae bacterium]